MRNLRQISNNLAKFVLWFGLLMAGFLVITALTLPASVYLSDYIAGIPFPSGYTATTSILVLLCLTVFVKSLRRIQANQIIVIDKQPNSQKANDKKVIMPVKEQSLPIEPSPAVKTNINKSEDNFFDQHEVILVDDADDQLVIEEIENETDEIIFID